VTGHVGAWCLNGIKASWHTFCADVWISVVAG